MIILEKLINVLRKWHDVASQWKKRIPFSKNYGNHLNASSCFKFYAGEKGCFVIYTTDQKRSALPLAYLCKSIILELLKMSAEEFGLSRAGPITLPCDSVLMNYVVLLLRRGVAKDLEKALLNTVATSYHSSSALYNHKQNDQFLLIYAS